MLSICQTTVKQFVKQFVRQFESRLNRKEMSKNTQVGVRIPNEIYEQLDRERLQALERGEKVTLTELVVKYLRLGLGESPEALKDEVPLMSTLERLTDVLERLEAKI
jgi:hypothetical protein